MEKIWDDLIRMALKEDAGDGDLTSELLIPHDHRSSAAMRAKAPGIVSGLSLAVRVFELLDESVDIVLHKDDGDYVKPGDCVAEFSGHTRKMLAGESFSGIETQRYTKTIPLWRFAQKKAVRHGGGVNHRMSLSDAILIKDNHLSFFPETAEAVRRAKAQKRMVDLIEVEITEPAQVEPMIDAGADILLLDNMTPEQVRECVKLAGGRARIEVSGGVKPENIMDYAIEGVDVISLGYLTHSAPALDFSMKITGEVKQ